MGQTGENYVSSVGGEVVSSLITDTTSMRIEVLRRETAGRMHWHFRQPELCLFLFAKGAERLRATIDGRSVNCTFPGKSRLATLPAPITINGYLKVRPTLPY